MQASEVLGSIGKMVVENSPEILTALGVSGVISTSYLSGQASYKARDVVLRAELYEDDGTLRDKPVILSWKEKVKRTWKLYIPAAASGVVSIGCMIASNRTSNNRTTAMVTAYSLSEKAFSEYKDKVVEQIGVTKEQKVRDAIAEETVRNNPPSHEILMVGDGGRILFCDMYSRRYFRSDMETVKRHVNRINELLNNGDYASLDDWYDLIGLDATQHSGTLGWKIEHGLMDIEMSHVAVYDPNGVPTAAYTFNYLDAL